MGMPLKKLTIRGFKSIASLEDFELGNLNVLIGANGSGKSNFVDFFRMLRAMTDEALVKFVNQQGGGDGFFFLGPQYTKQISARLVYSEFAYEFEMEPTATSELLISNEQALAFMPDEINRQKQKTVQYPTFSKGLRESSLHALADLYSELPFDERIHTVLEIFNALNKMTIYHFHDTSLTAPMRREHSVRDWEYLRPDAANIAAYLLYLSQNNPQAYALIRDTVRQIAPFFDDFMLRPTTRGPEELVRLEWKQRGSDFPFQPYQLSDGTIRFICLATALLQPNLPSTIVIDEPELGLHPVAIALLAAMIQSAATKTQIIVSTQSPTLLDHFAPEDVIVVNRYQGQSTFQRLNSEQLKEWLDEYTIGELWQKNVVEGGPVHE